MYKFSWNTRGFGANDLNHRLPMLNRALCPPSERADKVEVALPEYRYRFCASGSTVRTKFVTNPHHRATTPTTTPFPPPPCTCFSLFRMENGPQEFFTRFYLTYSTKSSPRKLSRSTQASWLPPFFHTFPIQSGKLIAPANGKFTTRNNRVLLPPVSWLAR